MFIVIVLCGAIFFFFFFLFFIIAFFWLCNPKYFLSGFRSYVFLCDLYFF